LQKEKRKVGHQRDGRNSLSSNARTGTRAKGLALAVNFDEDGDVP
jgi:hypothetical protein